MVLREQIFKTLAERRQNYIFLTSAETPVRSRDIPRSNGQLCASSERMREGRDIDAMLPFLSTYMGHARYEDTLYYVHMVPDFYERVGTVDRTAWEKLLPEVHDEG